MTKSAPYPRLTAWPSLSPATARCQAFAYGRNDAGRRFLVIPGRLLAAAGLERAKQVYVSTAGDRCLVSSRYRSGQPRALTSSPERGPVLQLTAERLPAALREGACLVAGKGYVAVVPASEAAAYEHLPEFAKHDGMLKEETVPCVDAPVPSRPAILWRELKTAAYGRSERCLDVTGNVWSVAGFDLDAPLRVTKYNDGVLVENVSQHEANSQLRSKLARGKRAYGGKRFGRAVLSNIQGDNIRVVVMKGALALVGESRSLADFGLTEQDRRAYDTPATAEDAARNSLGNVTVVPLAKDALQVKVGGAWLTNYGFVPGQRFSIGRHPLIRNRLLAVLDQGGQYEVMHGEGSAGALQVPVEAIAHFKSPSLKVVGTYEGLHIQQHFAQAA